MRKITSLLMLFLAFCLTASADDFTPTSGAKYLLQCKKSSSFALYNADCVKSADDATNILSAWSQFDERSFFVIEGNATDGYTIRLAYDDYSTYYVYAVNTNNADGNVGVKQVTSGSTIPDDCYWTISSYNDGWNIIPKDGSNGWNLRGSYNGNQHVGQWEMNSTDDNTWYIQTPSEMVEGETSTTIGFPIGGYSDEAKAAATAVETTLDNANATAFYTAWSTSDANVLNKPTSTSGLYKIKNNALQKYLFQECDDKGITLINDGGDNTKYYWAITFDGNVATINSSVGTPLARKSNNVSGYSTGVATSCSPITLAGAPNSSTGDSYTENYFLLANVHSTAQSIYTVQGTTYNTDTNPYHLITWSSTTEGNQYAFEPVTLADGESIYTVNIDNSSTTFTPTVTYNGTYTGNATVQDGGFYIFSSTPASSDFTAATSPNALYEGSVTIDETNKTINVSYVKRTDMVGYDSNGNLTLTDGYYYLVNLDESRDNHLYNSYLYSGNDNNLTLQSSSLEETNNYIWKISNVSTTDGTTTLDIVNGQGTPISTMASSTVSTFSSLTLDIYRSGYDGVYFTQGLNCSNGDPFILSDNTCYLTTWTDGGYSANDNRWYILPIGSGDIYSVTISLPEGYTGDATYLTYTSTGEIAFNGGFFQFSSVPATTDFSSELDGYGTVVTIDSDAKTITAQYVKLPETGKYYRLKGGYSDNYAVASSSGNNVAMAERSSDNDATSIFYLDENSSLLNYSNGLYIYNTCITAPVGSTANTWTIAVSANDINAVTLYSNYSGSKWLYDNTSKLDRNSTIPTDASHTDWYFEEVETLPVTISSAGYATLYAPVALTIPEGVEAYGVSISGSEANLTAIETTIPANTGVLLKGSEVTYNFDITTTENTAATDLTGYIYTSNVSTDVTAYILSNGSNGIGFYRLENTSDVSEDETPDRTILGGRAYYIGTDNSVQAFALDLTPTGIESAIIQDANADAPLYDLSGRRVVKAQKGVYIQNGNKVYVK